MRNLALAVLPLLSGCVSFTYERHLTYEPVALEAIGELEIGTSDIGDVLEHLGAPLYVWEGVNDAVVFAYGSSNQREVGFTISVPLLEQANASFNYDDVSEKLKGYVLVFEPDLTLKIVRAGLLGELGKTFKRRPDTVE
jgi:hypothetical protein